MRIHPALVIGGLVAVAAAGGIALSRRPAAHHHESTKAVYYCPMHPTYTSDRPGDCPICNMKLVKKEPESATAGPTQADIAKRFQSICYLHNCPKLHEGKPCPMTVVAKPGEKVTCPICGTHIAEAKAPVKKILYWTDPMIPGYKAEGPGKSPMGMDLVPVYEEEAPTPSAGGSPVGYAPVLLTPQRQQLVGVTTAPAVRKHLTKSIRTVGTIAHDPELYQAQAEYIQAIRALEQARQSNIPNVVEQAQRLVDSTAIRLRHLGLSEDLIQEIATWTEPEHTLLFAHPGQPVWMYAQVYEYELPLIRVGQTVSVDAAALAGERFEGAIRAIDQMVEPMTRTTRIRAQLQDPEGHLKPAMFVNAVIEVDVGDVLTVPREAVFHTGTKDIVFVDQGEGLFEPRDVTVGAGTDEGYELKSGVNEGEAVVTSGNFLIDSESRLKAALEGISGGGHQHGQ